MTGPGLWCPSWTSHDDIGGEGEMTFFHECGKDEAHEGKHHCIGHSDLNTHEWDSCHWEW